MLGPPHTDLQADSGMTPGAPTRWAVRGGSLPGALQCWPGPQHPACQVGEGGPFMCPLPVLSYGPGHLPWLPWAGPSHPTHLLLYKGAGSPFSGSGS